MRKNTFVCICLLCLSFLQGMRAQGLDRADEIRRRLTDRENRCVLVAAHRGDWRNAPENSLAAINNVIKMGADIVEIDIQKTKDGQLILMHDNTLNRTTTGKGKVSDYTLDEIRKLKLKNGLGIHTRHTVPTLREALLVAKGKILVNLDKAYRFFDDVYALLEETGTTKQVIMKGGQTVQQVKEEFGKYLDEIIFMPVINLDKENAMTMIEDYRRKLDPPAFEFSYVSDTNPLPKKVGELLEGKSLIWYNTLWDTMSGGHDDDSALENPEKEYGYLIDTLKARIIQTDVPAFLIQYLEGRGLHSEDRTLLRLKSPDGKTELILSEKEDESGSRITYSVSHEGKEAVLPSPLGIVREDGQFSSDLQFISHSTPTRIDEKYELKSGKRLQCHNYANEQIARFANPEGKPMEIVLRAYNDGIAFRYRFPGESEEVYKITEEKTGFQVPTQGKAWIHPYDWNSRLKPSYETYCSSGIKIGSDSPCKQGWAYPMLFNTNGLWLMITEAVLDGNYCATHIRSSRRGLYTVCFAEKEEVVVADSPEPVSTLSWETPWRVVVVGNRLSDVVETNIVQNLNPPCVLEDTDWINPGRSSWSWWSDAPSTKSYETQIAYIDFTAEMGWEYILIDAGWHRMPSEDLEKITEYANGKQVGVWLWYHSGAGSSLENITIWNLMSDPQSRRKELDRIQKLGVRGIKVDFFDTDKQPVMKLYKDILEDAAKRHLMVNFHGATLPRGLERTYPNLLTVEAVKGAENLSNQKACDRAASHNATLPFTRNVVGSMDYTPVTFSNKIHKNVEAFNKTTAAHQLALSIVFESGVQNFADNKEVYRNLQAEARDLLEEVPAAWDETKLLEGYPGDYVILARRKGDTWYVGGINGTNKEKEILLDLSPLPENRNVHLIMDADTKGQFVAKDEKVTDALSLSMSPNGGFVLILRH